MQWKSWDQLCKAKDCGGLGFKDLEAYNIALLGKQLWRMITNKHSLLAKIYRSRYFSNSDPLNASLGLRPSFAWRSIMAAQKLIKQGARVLIENGKNTIVWQECWIGSKPASLAGALRLSEDNMNQQWLDDMKVSELIDESDRDWKQAKIERMFGGQVLEQIKRRSPVGKSCADSYVWDYTKTGHYTVKSSYWVQRNVIKPDNSEQEILQPSLDYLYQHIWKLEVSLKVQHFLWRFLSNSLSVAANMKYRHLAKESYCSRCDAEEESVNHLLFQCPYARLIWAASPIHAPPAGIWSDSVFTNLYWVLNQKKELPKEEVNDEFVPWLLWRIWKNRNEFLFRGKEYHVLATIDKAKEDAREWSSRNEAKVKEGKKTPSDDTNLKWNPPPKEVIKCNADAMWKKEDDAGGIGWIARDSNGMLKWAGAKKMQRGGTVIEMEAEAIRWAVQTLSGFGYKRMIFETDSFMLSKMIRGEEQTWPIVQPQLEEISLLLALNQQFEVVYYPRSGNKAAYRIAKETSTFTSSVPKLYSIVPRWLKQIVDLEMPL